MISRFRYLCHEITNSSKLATICMAKSRTRKQFSRYFEYIAVLYMCWLSSILFIQCGDETNSTV